MSIQSTLEQLDSIQKKWTDVIFERKGLIYPEAQKTCVVYKI